MSEFERLAAEFPRRAIGLRSVACFLITFALPTAPSIARTYPLMELFACPNVQTAQEQARKTKLAAGRPITEFKAENVTASGCAYSQVAIATEYPQPKSDISPFVAWSDAVDANGTYTSFVGYQGRRLSIKTSAVKQEVRYLYGQLTFATGQTSMGWVEMPKTPYGLVFTDIYRKNPKQAEQLIVGATSLPVPR